MTPVPFKLGKTLVLLAFAAVLGQAGARDLSPLRGASAIGVSPAADSAALADLPLETLMRVSVVPTASTIGQEAARPSEVYALHYVVPGVEQGVPAEQARREHLALREMRELHNTHVREF